MPTHKLTIGIASMSRKINTTQDYLIVTLHKLFEYLNESEKPFVRIIVLLTDNSTQTVQDRSEKLLKNFVEEIRDGILHVIYPSVNIYPKFRNNALKASGQRLPYGNSLKRSNWQAKLSLDFAFLFSYCSQLQSDYFINLEDDVVPINKTFLHDMLNFVEDENVRYPYWNSLLFSDWLSIGRLYRTHDLRKLVDMILISYEKQPVDFIMHHFELIQMADKFQEFRRKPGLFKHIGDVSTIEDNIAIKKKKNERSNRLKSENPLAVLTTNISQWQGYGIRNAYFPNNGSHSYFWGRRFQDGDIIDVTLNKTADIESIRMLTGFGKDHNRASEDRLLKGHILISEESSLLEDDSSKDRNHRTHSKRSCVKFHKLKEQKLNTNNGMIEYNSNSNDPRKILRNVKCVRFKILKGQSDWLVVRLILIRTSSMIHI